jgi:cyclopropane-fatty-acyl-phospholipid synthase
MSLAARAIAAAIDRGVVPTAALRAGIRAVCRQRLRDERRGGPAAIAARQAALITALRAAPIAIATAAANAQHYEVPAAFYALVLGPHRKYSSGLWPATARTLADAERAMLEVTAARAGLADGQRILDLGCGWGALALWAAAAYPRAEIVGLSNSHSQRAYIEGQAAARGLTNLRVITGDVNHVAPPGRFDRVVSVEMFEHVRNHAALCARITDWLAPDGRLFVHVFAHRALAYLYDDRGPTDWMAREFFTGGIMPSMALLPDGVRAAGRRGSLAASTAPTTRAPREAWLANLDAHAAEAIEVLGGGALGRQRYHRWRVFFLACAELFGFRDGSEWLVAHYRFAPR